MKKIIIAASIFISLAILSTSCKRQINVRPGVFHYASTTDDMKDIGSAD